MDSSHFPMANTVGAPEGALHKMPVQFHRGLFQGDTVLPLLFGLALAPLSTALRVEGGFKTRHQEEAITHLAHTDDVKVFKESPEETEATIAVAEGAASAERPNVVMCTSGEARW